MQNDKEKRQTQYGILQSDNDTNIAQEEGTVYGTAPALVFDEPEYNPIPAPKEITEEDKIKQGLMNMPRDLGIYNPSGRNMIIGSVLQKPDGKIQFEFVLDDGESVTKQSFEEHFKRNGIPFSSTPTGSVITVDPNSISSLAQLEKAKEGIEAEMKIFHKELYPIDQSKPKPAAYKPIPAPNESPTDEEINQQKSEKANQLFQKYAVLKDEAAKSLVFAAVIGTIAAIITISLIAAFPPLVAIAGAAIGISAASAGGLTLGLASGGIVAAFAATPFILKSAFLDPATVSHVNNKVSEHNANILQEKFPETNDFLKQINGVKADKNRNSDFDKDLKDIIRRDNVQDLMVAVKRGDVAKIQELLPNKETATIQNALNQVRGAPEQSPQQKASPQINMEVARSEAKAHATQVAGLQSTVAEQKTSKAEAVERSTGTGTIVR